MSHLPMSAGRRPILSWKCCKGQQTISITPMKPHRSLEFMSLNPRRVSFNFFGHCVIFLQMPFSSFSSTQGLPSGKVNFHLK